MKKAIAVVVVLIAIGYAITSVALDAAKTVYHSQVATCQRDDRLRQELNARVPGTNALKAAVISFAKSARKARLAEWRGSHRHSDLRAAQSYAGVAQRVQAHVHYNRVTIVNCKKVIKKP